MGKNSAFFLIISGLIMTMGGLGGIENSLTDEQMTGSGLFAILGLACMYCGTIAIRIIESKEQA